MLFFSSFYEFSYTASVNLHYLKQRIIFLFFENWNILSLKSVIEYSHKHHVNILSYTFIVYFQIFLEN